MTALARPQMTTDRVLAGIGRWGTGRWRATQPPVAESPPASGDRVSPFPGVVRHLSPSTRDRRVVTDRRSNP